jgi:sugar phosphate isomerase/epimerase
MMYVSSSCVKATGIKEAVEELHAFGFNNIELSGGTRPYSAMTDDLLALKKKGINFLCHNYFPPPTENFVLNLASLNEDIYKRSMDHVNKALELSFVLGADRFAVHAGFLIDIPLAEVGKSVSSTKLFDTKEAMARFVEAIKILQKKAQYNNVVLYIENNVLSDTNFSNFGRTNPFFICTKKDVEEIRQLVPGVKILADLAHLKVSCKTLGLNFEEEAGFFVSNTDYIHLSDNDGLSDSNKEITKDSELLNLLQKMDLKNKIITFEVYTGLEKLKQSYENINRLINA